MNGFEHLYVHLPPDPPHTDRVQNTLARELELRGGGERLAPALETVGMGGGGASGLGPGPVAWVREIVGDERLSTLSEWTVEASPAELGPALLRAWRKGGVTRVTLGVALDLGSLRESALQASGRDAVAAVASAGFDTWGVDLLYGLPPGLDSDPLETLREVVRMGAPHLSLYEWGGERAADSGLAAGADDDRAADQYLAMHRYLAGEGYEPYEMMSFARPGHASRHAMAVLRGASCLAVGPGAFTRAGERRFWNLRDWSAYCTAVEEDRMPRKGEETPDAAAKQLEDLWSGLRFREGVRRDGLGPASLDLADGWVRSGLAHPDPGRVRLTPEGWLRLDELAVELARAEASLRKPPPGRGRFEE